MSQLSRSHSGTAGRPFVLCAGACCLVTSRTGGVSKPPFGTLNLSSSVGDDPAAVASNRELVLAAVAAGPGAAGPGPGLGTGAVACRPAGPAGPGELAWMRQVHGPRTAYLAGPAAGSAHQDGRRGAGGPGSADQAAAPIADAVFTDSPAIALGVLVADCAPVLLADPGAGLVGAAHAGRAGLAAGVLDGLVGAMAGAGAEPARMHALIGPAICGGCYEVPADLRDEVAAAVPESACSTRSGNPGIDLSRGLRAQLDRLGIGAVSTDPRCTSESADLFSYRRDGVTGRFAGLIWLAPWAP